MTIAVQAMKTKGHFDRREKSQSLLEWQHPETEHCDFQLIKLPPSKHTLHLRFFIFQEFEISNH